MNCGINIFTIASVIKVFCKNKSANNVSKQQIDHPKAVSTLFIQTAVHAGSSQSLNISATMLTHKYKNSRQIEVNWDKIAVKQPQFSANN